MKKGRPSMKISKEEFPKHLSAYTEDEKFYRDVYLHEKEHPETLPLVADSAVLEYAMSLLNGNYSFHATVEAAYFFCRLITAANAESMRAMLPVVKGIGWLLTCDLDWRVTAKILQTLYKLATSLAPQDRIDVFDEELLENLEVVVSDKMGALACEILEVLA